MRLRLIAMVALFRWLTELCSVSIFVSWTSHGVTAGTRQCVPASGNRNALGESCPHQASERAQHDALIVIGLAVDTTQALIYSQIVLSFGFPFALIPLLEITSSPDTMTDMTNRGVTSALMFLVTSSEH
jgi:Mn2+/Fe2+ NRAMP family transporter